MRKSEKLISVGRDEEKYLHCRPTIADLSGEFTVSFFRETAETLLGKSLRAVEAMPPNELEELLENQMGRQLNLEVQAKWYSGGSKYSFIGKLLSEVTLHASLSHVTNALNVYACPVCPVAQRRPYAILIRQQPRPVPSPPARRAYPT